MTDSPDLLSLTLVVCGPDWLCEYASPSADHVLRLDGADLVGRSVLPLVHPTDRDRVAAALRGMSRPQRPEMLHVRLLDPAGESTWFELQLHARGTQPRTVFVFARDANERQATPIDEVAAAHRDSLTGAATRAILLDHAQQALLRLERQPGWVALLFLDLDRLKPVNDALGHHAGDAVLRELVRRVLGLLRPVDTLARLGGDEFAVLVGDLQQPADAHKLARRIVALSRVVFDVDGHDLDCSVSVGLALSSDHTQSTEALLRQADVAMYEAKASGGGRWRAWGLHSAQRLSAQHRVEAILGEAVRTHKVVLDYQPVVRLADDREVGSEALLRVVQPDGSLLRPPAFLDVAIAQRLIGPLDVEVLRHVVTDRRTVTPSLPVDLNLASVDVENDTWYDAAQELLSGPDGSRAGFHLELREDGFRELSAAAVGRLGDLREQGLLVGLDGFGAGASAFSTLWSFPLDYVKLDPSLTAQLPTVRSARAMMRAVCEVAHSLGLLVIANGVEDEEQRALALECGCDQGQGFLWPARSAGAPRTALAVVLAAQNGHQPGAGGSVHGPGTG